MKSKFFKEFGIYDVENEIDARRDDFKLPRLFFISTGNPTIGLDIGGAIKLRELMANGGETENASEIDDLIAKARRQ